MPVIEHIKVKQENVTGLLNSRKNAELTCSFCDEDLWGIALDGYEHDNGWLIPGVEKKHWLSIKCPECGLNNSLTMFGIR